MKIIFILTVTIYINTSYADQTTPCAEEPKIKYFISNWSSDGDSSDILTSINANTGETSVSEGRIVASEDLNSDNNIDLIFKSYDGIGSSNESTFTILIKCRGYYTYAGGDYYAGIKVSNEKINNYKKIIAESYKRDSQSQIIYKGKNAELTKEILIFNPIEIKYTTSHEKQ
ncbi:hypothetical protein HNP46_005847 [Pseudomonas nitritireducens]|uniref:Uncharacterized protein n=1 Tax=Pseudomonas nitroreducens TaxID=46680 RepID=A0A7W7KQ48_PSENT|nr:hypothetical protein [Pseudomonas nitritireducens]MBB4866939.1 hypothetical protein [Pseudomonas nitritireducens]